MLDSSDHASNNGHFDNITTIVYIASVNQTDIAIQLWAVYNLSNHNIKSYKNIGNHYFLKKLKIIKRIKITDRKPQV